LLYYSSLGLESFTFWVRCGHTKIWGGAHSDELEERVRLFANIASQETSYKLILHMIYTVVAYGQLSQ